jgi:hypothetical protein
MKDTEFQKLRKSYSANSYAMVNKSIYFFSCWSLNILNISSLRAGKMLIFPKDKERKSKRSTINEIKNWDTLKRWRRMFCE